MAVLPSVHRVQAGQLREQCGAVAFNSMLWAASCMLEREPEDRVRILLTGRSQPVIERRDNIFLMELAVLAAACPIGPREISSWTHTPHLASGRDEEAFPCGGKAWKASSRVVGPRWGV